MQLPSSTSAKCGMCGTCNAMPPWAPESLENSTSVARKAIHQRLEEKKLHFIASRDARLAQQSLVQNDEEQDETEYPQLNEADQFTTTGYEIKLNDSLQHVQNSLQSANQIESASNSIALPEKQPEYAGEDVQPSTSSVSVPKENDSDTLFPWDDSTEMKSDTPPTARSTKPTASSQPQIALSTSEATAAIPQALFRSGASVLSDFDSDADSFHTAEDESVAGDAHLNKDSGNNPLDLESVNVIDAVRTSTDHDQSLTSPNSNSDIVDLDNESDSVFISRLDRQYNDEINVNSVISSASRDSSHLLSLQSTIDSNSTSALPPPHLPQQVTNSMNSLYVSDPAAQLQPRSVKNDLFDAFPITATSTSTAIPTTSSSSSETSNTLANTSSPSPEWTATLTMKANNVFQNVKSNSGDGGATSTPSLDVDSWNSDNLEEVVLASESKRGHTRRASLRQGDSDLSLTKMNDDTSQPQHEHHRTEDIITVAMESVDGDVKSVRGAVAKDVVQCEDCQAWRKRVVQLEEKVESLSSSLASKELDLATLRARHFDAGRRVPKTEARLIQECEGLRITTEFLVCLSNFLILFLCRRFFNIFFSSNIPPFLFLL